MISFLSLPAELHLDILTYLRATELSVLSKSCKTFDNKKLILRCVISFWSPPSIRLLEAPILFFASVASRAHSLTVATFSLWCISFRIINHFASDVYPSELTEGFDTAIVGGDINDSYYSTFESLRNMEMLVVARGKVIRRLVSQS